MPYRGDLELSRAAQCAKPLLASPCASHVVVRPLPLFFPIEWLRDVSSYPLSSSLVRTIAAAKDEQAGPSRAKAKSTAPGCFQRNYLCQVLVRESCYRPVLSGLQLSLTKLQLAISLAAELLRLPLAEVDDRPDPKCRLS